MKFNLIKQILFFLGLIVFLENCSSSNKYEDYEKLKIVDLDKRFKKILHTDAKGNIVYLDIYVLGEIIGKGKLRFYHPPLYENFSEMLIEGKIDEGYRTDWYANDILIEYIPVDTVNGGSILLRYKLLTF